MAFVEQSKQKRALDSGAEHNKQLPEGNLSGIARDRSSRVGTLF
jgi:hypothetical protein